MRHPFLLLVIALVLVSSVRAADPVVDHVIVISVDGLRSDALMPRSRSSQPSFRRLTNGALTLNARTDPFFTTTQPNHAAMITGRVTRGDRGHGVVVNSYEEGNPLIHEMAGGYVPGMFDVAHDHGVHTGIFAGKTKFAMFDKSWDAGHGAADMIAPDHGPDKIDRFVYAADIRDLTNAAIETLAQANPRTLVLVHYGLPDGTGHAKGWDLTANSPYMLAIDAVDEQIGRLLNAVAAHEHLVGRTAIILTADHGGGAPHRTHTRAEMWVNYIIPFIVWTGDAPERHTGLDLYELNQSTRRDPGLKQPAPGTDFPPIRNGDAANVALSLLGLPPVPGSTINAKQDLVVVAP